MCRGARSKRVCMVVQNYYQIDPRVRREADILVERGYEVDVIALGENGRPRVERLNGLTIYGLPLRKKRGSRVRYAFEYSAFWMMVFLLLAFLTVCHRYAVIGVNTLPDFLVFAALLPKLVGSKVVLDMHEIMPEFFASKYGIEPDHPFVELIKWQEKWSARFADWVLVSNDLLAERLLGRGLPASKVTVVMNCADESLFMKVPRTETAAHNDLDAPLVLMYHGTLTEIYGLDIAIVSMARLLTLRPDMAVQLCILGDGPAHDQLVMQAEHLGLDGRVRFLGSVPLDQVPGYLARCDVGLVPTRQDLFLDLSFSNKLVEYVVMEKPVIAARLGGYCRYFREDSLAYFEPGNPDSLVETILRLAHDRAEWPKRVANALDDYRSVSWDVMGARYIEVVDRLAS
jgi:glycosyltransferase involved in cell wall biosynthesis